MPNIGIDFDTKRLRASIDRMRKYTSATRPIHERIARHMRDYVKDTVRMGGRKRTHKPLSEWTKWRTGRSKPFGSHFIPGFKYTANAQGAMVYFEAPGGKPYTATMHHKGFTSPAVRGKLMAVPGAKGGYRVFNSRKASKIPAREIWPTKAETEREVAALVREWIREGAYKSWR